MLRHVRYHLVNLLVISVAVFGGIGIAQTIHIIELNRDHDCYDKGRALGAESRIISGACYIKIGDTVWLDGIDYKEQRERRRER